MVQVKYQSWRFFSYTSSTILKKWAFIHVQTVKGVLRETTIFCCIQCSSEWDMHLVFLRQNDKNRTFPSSNWAVATGELSLLIILLSGVCRPPLLLLLPSKQQKLLLLYFFAYNTQSNFQWLILGKKRKEKKRYMLYARKYDNQVARCELYTSYYLCYPASPVSLPWLAFLSHSTIILSFRLYSLRGKDSEHYKSKLGERPDFGNLKYSMLSHGVI